MKRISQLTLLLIFLGGLISEPAFSQDQNKKAPTLSQKQEGRQKKIDPTDKMEGMQGMDEMKGMKGMANMEGMESMEGMDGMMGGSMMSRQSDMILMLNTMKEMAQMLKEQAKDPDSKAKADQALANIEKMKNHHQMRMKMRMEMMEMMMGMMDTMMPEHGGAPSKK